MPTTLKQFRLVAFLILVSAAVLLAGCKTTGSLSGDGASSSAGTQRCAESRAECRKRKLAELKAMIDDPENKWVGERGRGRKRVFTSTTRLLAYISTAQQLTCAQLFIGDLETSLSSSTLKSGKIDGDVAKGTSLAVLADQANKIIKKESATRCDGILEKAA